MVNFRNTFNKFWNNTEDITTGTTTINTTGTAAILYPQEIMTFPVDPAWNGDTTTGGAACVTTANACWSGPSFRKVSKKEFMVGMPQFNIKLGRYNADTWQGGCVTTCTPEWTTTDRMFAHDYNTTWTTNDTTAATDITLNLQ